MLGTLPEKKAAWCDMVPSLLYAYNYTKSNATGSCPYYQMYGCKPQLPMDLYFGMLTMDMNANTNIKFCAKIKGKTTLGLQNGTTGSWKGESMSNIIMTIKLNMHVWKKHDLILLNQTTYDSKQKIQRCRNKTIYEDDGKVEVVHRKLILPVSTNVEISGNEGSQQSVNILLCNAGYGMCQLSGT